MLLGLTANMPRHLNYLNVSLHIYCRLSGYPCFAAEGQAGNGAQHLKSESAIGEQADGEAGQWRATKKKSKFAMRQRARGRDLKYDALKQQRERVCNLAGCLKHADESRIVRVHVFVKGVAASSTRRDASMRSPVIATKRWSKNANFATFATTNLFRVPWRMRIGWELGWTGLLLLNSFSSASGRTTPREGNFDIRAISFV